MQKQLKLGIVAISAALLLVASCSRPSDEKQPPVAEGVQGMEYVAADAVGGATVQVTNDVITVTRAGDESVQGVTIRQSPAGQAQGAFALTFAVEGRGARVRVRQAPNWYELPAEAEQHTVMLGRGGALQIRVFSRRTPEITVRILDMAPCSQVECSPLTGPPVEDN